MARQNIDEKWKIDPRRTALAKRIGGRAADGMRVEINWLVLDHKGAPIPFKEFQYIENAQDWIECGLAEVRGDVVHVAGADRYAKFFEKQKANGDKGGRPAEANETQTNPTETQTKPEKPSSSFSSSKNSLFSAHEDLEKAISIQDREYFAKKYPDPGWLKDQIELCHRFHSADEAQCPRTKGQWMRKLHSWLAGAWKDRGKASSGQKGSAPAGTDWEQAAALVLDAIVKAGSGSQAHAERERALGPELHAVAIKAGIQRIRDVQRGPYQLRNIAEMLKQASELLQGGARAAV